MVPAKCYIDYVGLVSALESSDLFRREVREFLTRVNLIALAPHVNISVQLFHTVEIFV